MDDAIDECRREARVAKDAIPLAELKVGRDDQALSLIPVSDEMEQEFRRFFCERDVSHLVQNDQVCRFET